MYYEARGITSSFISMMFFLTSG